MGRLSPEDEELERKFQSMPLFMDSFPQEGDTLSPAMEALQALLDETDPNDLASGLKESGNEAYRLGRKRWDDAIQYYTNALGYPVTDKALLATIYANRAQVHLQLGNLGKALHDCKQSLENKDKSVKVIYRAGRACFLLGRYKDCMDYCVKGLRIEPKNDKISVMFDDAKRKLMEERRGRLEKKSRADAEREANERISQACREREIRLVEDGDGSDDDDDSPLLPGDSLLDYRPYIDDDSNIHWPVLILYPEYHTTDVVRDWHELSSFRDVFQVMLSPRPDWDVDQNYAIDQIRVFYRNESSNDLYEVDLDSRLIDAMKRPSFNVYHRLPTFLITSYASTAYWNENVQQFIRCNKE
uniref:Cns1/TTC4 wheel domain-containing protein n=1 Tax=Spongospora subterranea TaxID=70186 RepID=A0A0H5R7Q7_9EUKA|eukprot:CRZ10163.1 hypothetical protein [Spongospora subterranea]